MLALFAKCVGTIAQKTVSGIKTRTRLNAARCPSPMLATMALAQQYCNVPLWMHREFGTILLHPPTNSLYVVDNSRYGFPDFGIGTLQPFKCQKRLKCILDRFAIASSCCYCNLSALECRVNPHTKRHPHRSPSLCRTILDSPSQSPARRPIQDTFQSSPSGIHRSKEWSRSALVACKWAGVASLLRLELAAMMFALELAEKLAAFWAGCLCTVVYGISTRLVSACPRGYNGKLTIWTAL